MKTHTQALQLLQNLTFGIEIECMFPKHLARQYGIEVSSYNWREENMIDMNHINDLEGNAITEWRAGYDSTISRKRDFHGIEFTSRILKGEEGLKNVVRFFKWLDAKGAIVDRSCGLHIHIGLQAMTEGDNIDQAIETVLRTMKFANSIKTTIFAQNGSAYRYLKQSYARPNINKNLAEQEARNHRVPVFNHDKFTFLNTHRTRHNGVQSRKATIEFRAFAGTCNYLKVLNHLLTAFVCAHGGMTSKRASWNGKFDTADKGVEAFDSFARTMTSKKKRKELFNLFPTFVENKRAMFSIGRKMAKKFATNIRRAVSRSNGTLDLTRFV
jgi:hypothetical protein